MEIPYFICKGIHHKNTGEDETEDPNRDKQYKVILCGFLVHLLLLFAVFDVYFASPLDQGISPVKSNSNPPAKRLVLMVADGLRAEAVYGRNHETRIPFLSKVKESGTWGVVHAKVPTESRPCHVAMLAGIYEDPGAIFNGWKANPVNFDSVIAQSANSWCWGSPDIVRLFNTNRSPTVLSHAYSLQMAECGKTNPKILDNWVYEKVENFLKGDVQSCSATSCKRYFSGGNIFFLHLLGTDTAGHTYTPLSEKYTDNIIQVDKIVENVTKLFESTFIDHSTAFIFTADHGMADWAAHGGGSPHESEAPIVAWGAGVKVNSQREDINQIDLAPLLASLIGINIPVNSLGMLPVNYVNLSEDDLAKALLSNTLQLFKIFDTKRLRIENNAIVYVPFKGVTTISVQEKLDRLRELKYERNFNRLLKECTRFMKFLTEGITYFHNYYKYPVLISVSIGFLGWILYLSVLVLLHDKQNRLYSVTSKRYKKVTVTMVLIVLLLCYKQKFPVAYYLYFSFPVVMLSMALHTLKYCSAFNNLHFVEPKKNVVNIAFYVIGSELLLYGFFNRTAITVLMIFVGFWIYLSKTLNKVTNKKEKFIWICCSFVLAAFPSFPVVKASFNAPVFVAGFLGWIYLFKVLYINKMGLYYQLENIGAHYKAFIVQFLCLIFSAGYILLLENEYIPHDSNFKYVSWLFLLVPVLMIPLTSTFIAVRLTAIFFAFGPFCLLVSPYCEVLFLVFYVALLCCWLSIEARLFEIGKSNIVYYAKFGSYKSKYKFSDGGFRRAFLFVVFIFLGFLGTGSIASLRTLDPMWVRAFLAVFKPFKMMELVLLKFLVPLIFTCCIFRAINSVGKENNLHIFCTVLILSDLMVLQFLYLVTNEGSWFEIGISLTHFITMEAFVIILLLLYGIAHILTTVSY